ncbi:MAG: alpha/beta hydrolase [Ilumatobacteraceae bacterium]
MNDRSASAGVPEPNRSTPATSPAAGGPIVLVHGAWVGAWSWEPLLDRLDRSGRRIVAVSLRGAGDRRDEASSAITLEDHVDDVVGVVESADLHHVTLVGHSYGGRVITRAWARLAERIVRLVYLDAHAPLLDDGAFGVGSADLPGACEGGMIPPFGGFDPDPADLGGDEAHARFVARCVDHPARALRAPFHVDLPADLPKTYVAATAERNRRFEPYARAARGRPDWEFRELPGSHWLMYTHPDEVADIVLDNSWSTDR